MKYSLLEKLKESQNRINKYHNPKRPDWYRWVALEEGCDCMACCNYILSKTNVRKIRVIQNV